MKAPRDFEMRSIAGGAAALTRPSATLSRGRGSEGDIGR